VRDIKPPYTKDRVIVDDSGKSITYSDYMNLASKVMEMLESGEIEPIKSYTIATGTIKADTILLNNQ
jgi:hypothetical protein